jgi:hypothetical protein
VTAWHSELSRVAGAPPVQGERDRAGLCDVGDAYIRRLGLTEADDRRSDRGDRRRRW